ncbi:hypothetical protein EZV62_025707 [Acer yangbiense]|uniref:Uncharacterized protein n=1 Tax=Acer yangbiense TaxID=1000413 RepID=A0A5C7GZY4_9ROSI|nr:hypothetical protein EZV62_025707 [Acer yangbiense]
MAVSHFFFTVSLLLFSLLLVVSAGDYAYNTKPSGDNQDSKSETNYSFNLKADLGKSKSESHDYGYTPEAPKPKPEGGDYNTKPTPEEKPKSESHDYGYKPEAPKPTPEEKPKSESHDNGYKPETPKLKPEYKPETPKSKPEYKPETPKLKPEYKPETPKSKPEYKPETPKLKPEYKPETPKSKPEDNDYNTKTKSEDKPKFHLTLYFFIGAVAKVTCLVDDIYGSKTTLFSISSKATDSKGYFLAELSSLKLSDNLKLKQCKVFLDNSPLKDCNIPTDVNRGITGALLNSYRILNEKKIKLYSVGPFFFTPVTKSTPIGY